MNSYTLQSFSYCLLYLYLIPQSLRLRSSFYFYAISLIGILASPVLYNYDDVAALADYLNIIPTRSILESFLTGNLIPDFWVGLFGFHAGILMSISLSLLLWITYLGLSNSSTHLAPAFISPAFLFLLRGQIQQLCGFVAAYAIFVYLYSSSSKKAILPCLAFSLTLALPYAISQILFVFLAYSYLKAIPSLGHKLLALHRIPPRVLLRAFYFSLALLSFLLFFVFVIHNSTTSDNYVFNKLFFRYSSLNYRSVDSLLDSQRPFSLFGGWRVFSAFPFFASFILYVVSTISQSSRSLPYTNSKHSRSNAGSTDFLFLLLATFLVFFVAYSLNLPSALDRLVAPSSILLAFIVSCTTTSPVLVSRISGFLSISYTFVYFEAISVNLS